jgi:monoamine oxidase
MAMTRRSLLASMAKLGGAGAVYETLVAWDFLKPPPAMATTFELPKDSGKGKTVAILGAGVAGLCAAYELDRAGYDCVILEPARRAGGRSLTLRRGDSFKEMGDCQVQHCEFDEGLWLNAGPGRIPHHHVHVIDYCRRFGIALQPYIFASRANLVHSGFVGNGKTYPVRRAFYDLQGHVAELLAKCVGTPGIDLGVSKPELEKLTDMLANFGNLTKIDEPGKARTYSYKNQFGRAGFEVPPGLANEPGKPLSPLALDEIPRSNVWNDFIFRDAEYYWQTSLMEPVGGMDNFFKAFLRQPLTRQNGTIDGLVRYGAKATAIEVKSDKVSVLFDDNGNQRTLIADYCISTVPMPIFKNMKTNLSAPFMDSAKKLKVFAAGKVGWQADRFWETKDQIYGGISWTTDVITQVWYPSSGYLSGKGVLTGAYMYGEAADGFNTKTVAERLQIARDQGDKLHDGYGKMVEHGIAIGWNNMEFARMGWADEGDPTFGTHAQVLSKPQGRFVIAGDKLTYWSGWQEGAIMTALEAVKSIDKQTRPTGGG